jgi:SAM-dependent methyltransferase
MNNTKNINHPETQARVANNVQALLALKTGERAALENYSGWGGLRDALYDRDTFCKLKFDCGLSDSDIAAIKASCSSGYFTPAHIVQQMWHICQTVLPDAPKRILDPASGTGHFFKLMPQSWQGAELTAIELEPLSARIAQARLPAVDILTQDFGAYQGGDFDCVIGNPPYSKARLQDAQYTDLNQYCIHHAFALKAFRLLKVGGVLCFLLPSWFMDNARGQVRDIMAEEGAELVGAWRLPDNCFQNAKVTVDCVVIKKCPIGTNNKAWAKLGTVSINGKRERINQHFLDKPECVLGRLDVVPMYERMGLTCRATEDCMTLWQVALKGQFSAQVVRATDERKASSATLSPMVTVSDSEPLPVEGLLVQCEKAIRKLSDKVRELQGLKAQQEVLQASLRATLGHDIMV